MSVYYKKIKALVTAGQVSLTQIIAVPRSTSTFFEISLAEATNGNQINEPFFGTPFDDACKQIYERLIQLGAENPSQTKPVRLVIKDIAGHLKSYDLYRELIDNFIFLTRDPHTMMPSLVRRLAHTVLGDKGGDFLSTDEAFDHVAGVDQLLAQKSYNGTSWKRLDNLLKNTRLYLHSKRARYKTLSVIDSNFLAVDPETIMRRLCERIGLPFKDSMLEGPKKAGGANFYYPNAKDDEKAADGSLSNSAWIGDSINSTSFMGLLHYRYPLERYPEGLAGHMRDIYRIYKKLAGDPAFIGPANGVELLAWLRSPANRVGGDSMLDVAPTTAYVYLAAFAAIEKDPGVKKELLRQMTYLRTNHEDFRSSFEALEGSQPPAAKASVKGWWRFFDLTFT